MRLTKTDFQRFLQCQKSFWLSKRKPEVVPKPDPTAHLKRLARDGYEVEAYAKAFFETKNDPIDFTFQEEFESANGLYARVDILGRHSDGTIDIYEVKSTTTVKKEHVLDAAFQMIVAQAAGTTVNRVYVVHLDGTYVRQGDVDCAGLFKISDQTEAARVNEISLRTQIQSALNFLQLDAIDETSCSCLQRGRSSHCDTFGYLNPTIPEPSIYTLPRIKKEKLAHFAAQGRFDLSKIAPDEVSKTQALLVQSAHRGGPVINLKKIAKFYHQVEYPLHFLDYETFASAVPKIDGTRPHMPIPFQYSLHIKKIAEDRDAQHFEYLADALTLPEKMIAHMEQQIGPTGNIISWHASFEKTQNKNMAKWYPERAAFLNGINARMIDLEDIFKLAYVDIAFGGSTSIKKVLPILVKDLDYSGMDVASGTDAMEAWIRYVDLPPGFAKDTLGKNLLQYCELDTYAMVRIFDEVRRLL